MNSGNLKTCKYVKIFKSNFFTNTILFLRSILLESKNTHHYKVINKIVSCDHKYNLKTFLNNCYHYLKEKFKNAQAL